MTSWRLTLVVSLISFLALILPSHAFLTPKPLGSSSSLQTSDRLFRPSFSAPVPRPSTFALSGKPSLFNSDWAIGGLLTVGALLPLLLLRSICVIEPGQVGVVSQLGTVSQISPGLHLVSPLSKISRFTTKTQLLEQSNFVPTREGLTVELDTAVLYRINPEEASKIFRTVGTDYSPTLVEPEASSTVRGLTSEVDAKALYTSGRSTIQTKLRNELTEKLTPRGILVEDVLLKAIKLPDDLTRAIEQKAKAEQESERMEFVLTKERQEAERKSIEAQGISDFQSIVSKGISNELLQWKGIEATEKLAKSSNSKIVIIGNAKGGLPVILGGSGQ